MCIDYTNLNKACPKDAYPLSNIDRLVDETADNRILSSLDAFSGYNQIPMYDGDVGKTTFITKASNYFYQVMLFGLKNVGSTFQRLMNQVFKKQIGWNVEVYVDDMMVKSEAFDQHLIDLKEVFGQLRHFGMHPNPGEVHVRGGRRQTPGLHADPQGNRRQPRQVFNYSCNAEPYKFERGTKCCWKTNISLPFFA